MSKKYLDNHLSTTEKSNGNDDVYMSEDRANALFKKNAREAQSTLEYLELLNEAVLLRQHLESLSEKEHIEIGEIDKHFLQGFLACASRLHATGKISESDYISLVTHAAESYAERLVDSKIAKALEKYELYLEKAGMLWLS